MEYSFADWYPNPPSTKAEAAGGRNEFNDREFRLTGASAARSAAQHSVAGNTHRRSGLAAVAARQAGERDDASRRLARHAADYRGAAAVRRRSEAERHEDRSCHAGKTGAAEARRPD